MKLATSPPSASGNDRPDWRWWLGPLVLATALVAAVLPAALGAAVLGAGETSSLIDRYPYAAGLLQDAIWIAVVIAVPLIICGTLHPQDLGLGRARVRAGIAATVLGLLAFAGFAALYGAAAGLGEDANERLQDTGIGASVGADLGYVALYVVMAPVAEELLFRGALFGSLREGIGALPAALLSGAVFGLIHLGGGQDPFIPVLAALGVVLALAYQYSGALYAPIAIHAINNAVSTASSSDPAADWIYVLFVAGPLLALCVAWAIGRGIGRFVPDGRVGRGKPDPDGAAAVERPR